MQHENDLHSKPGIREAIEQREWKEAQEQIEVDAEAITRLAEYLKNTELK